MRFFEFWTLVFSSWVERVGIILTILPFIERIARIKAWLSDKPIIDRFLPVLWLIGSICVIWGFYSAWTEERDATDAAKAQNQVLQKRLDELTQPKFELETAGAVIGDSSITNGKEITEHTHVFQTITVLNHGAPSIIRSIKMKAILANGKEYEGTPYVPNQPEFVFHDAPNAPIRFPTSSSLAPSPRATTRTRALIST